jgi:hypothetical protein
MAYQKVIVCYRGFDKLHSINVEASEVSQKGTYWQFTGSKATLWVSSEAFVYAITEAMEADNKEDNKEDLLVGH